MRGSPGSTLRRARRAVRGAMRRLRRRRRGQSGRAAHRLAGRLGAGVGPDVARGAARAKRKPVIVSIGDMAASGGYYVASAGSEIIAQDQSLVGSIGVVGGKIVVEEPGRAARRERRAPARRGKHAGWDSPCKRVVARPAQAVRERRCTRPTSASSRASPRGAASRARADRADGAGPADDRAARARGRAWSTAQAASTRRSHARASAAKLGPDDADRGLAARAGASSGAVRAHERAGRDPGEARLVEQRARRRT